MATKTKAPSKGKGAGRKARNDAYKLSKRRELNKLLRIEGHQKKHLNDKQEVGLVPNYKTKKVGISFVRDGVKYIFDSGWRPLNADSMQ